MYRQRIVHHMVFGELVLRPLPITVAHRVSKDADALGVKDEFVRVAGDTPRELTGWHGWT